MPVQRRVPDDAGVLRLAGRRPVLPVQPRLVRDPAGRRRVPHQARGLPQGLRALDERRQRAAVGADHHALRRLAQARDALQRLSRRSRSPAARRRATARARRSTRWRRSPRETLPGDFAYAWAGQALQEKESGSTSSSAFIFGLIVVFLLLAAQFEKWTLPIAVVLTVPFAVLGALLLTWLLGLRERRLLPGGPGHAGRAVGEERDPDLRVRDRARAPRHVARARRRSRRRACGCAPSS